MEEGMGLPGGGLKDQAPTLVQQLTDFFLDNVWQLVCAGAALFAFYEDRALCACGLAGFVGLCGGIVSLERKGLAPFHAQRLWATVLPACGAFAVLLSVCCRVWGASWSLLPICALQCAAVAGATVVTVGGDKDAKLRL
mmetsp:Transcript_17914/g.38116  ORF Transcript_17914/g.38116 Transcript_17914/m.38116 type:complete len:139 (+) Transcript_17914:80-496(+)